MIIAVGTAFAGGAEPGIAPDQVERLPPPGAGEVAAYFKEAAQLNLAVIQFAQVGSQRGQNPELRQFCDQVERDQKKAQDTLQAIAKKHHLEITISLDIPWEEELGKLRNLSGALFDQALVKRAAHASDWRMAKLKSLSAQTLNPDLAQYGKEMIAQFGREHDRLLETAKTIGLPPAVLAALEIHPDDSGGTAGASIESAAGASVSIAPAPTAPARQP